MDRVYINDLVNYIGKEVCIKCWVEVARSQSKIVFFDFRDITGRVQGVFLLKNTDTPEKITEIKKESVVLVRGLIKERPDSNKKDGVQNGNIEMEILDLNVLSSSETPPFDIVDDNKKIDEEVRFEHRYIDLRRSHMQNNIIQRHNVMQYVRAFFSDRGFFEIETPCLTKTTPEGARDYIVPSRIDNGKFYALPQSPQQYKQLLMTAGFEKYFQIARCFRDEDLRGDRQPEFTQIDMEMSFVSEDDVMNLNEKMLIGLIKELYPEKEIQSIPFPRITYKEAMEKYGTDRPDLRDNKNNENILAFCWIIDFPFFEKNKKDEWTFTHNPFSIPKEGYIDDLLDENNISKILAVQYDIVLNGFEIGGGSIRSHRADILKKVFEIIGYSEEQIQNDIGHMLRAFSLGTPPHGGIAFGLDRLMMLLQNEQNIREVIAFPKTREGKEKMVQSPSKISFDQLHDLGISIKKDDINKSSDT